MPRNKPWLIPWMAGFFDGEGYIGIIPHRDSHRPRPTPHYQLYVKIGQKSRMLLNLFQASYGGQVHFAQNEWGGSWEWRIVSKQAVAFLEAVLPYLMNKGDEARLALEFQSQLVRSPGRKGLTEEQKSVQEAQYLLMREMKKRVA